jgi:radical SAM-linked protein
MARGDRHVGRAILRAWELGCRFDDWRETFRFDLWRQAFEETGIDPWFYNQRPRGEQEIFPWELVSCGVSREFLWLEWTRALKGKATYDCRDRRTCTLCEICTQDYRHDLYPATDGAGGPSLVDMLREKDVDSEQPVRPSMSLDQEDKEKDVLPEQGPARTLRLQFSKTGPARWLSQLDLQRTLIQTFRRAELPLVTGLGFNPRPHISFAMALPVGTECLGEWVDIDLRDEAPISGMPDDQLRHRLNAVSPPGIDFRSLEWIPADSPSLAQSARCLVGAVRWIPQTPEPDRIMALLQAGLARYEETKHLISYRPAREDKPAKRVDLAPFIEEIRLEEEDGRPILRVSLHIDGGRTVRPDEVALALAGEGALDPVYMDAQRSAVILEGVVVYSLQP